MSIQSIVLVNRPNEQLLVEAGIGQGMRVLDVGRGSGDVTRLLARPGSTGSVIGIDRDLAALANARQITGAAGTADVTFVENDLGSSADAHGPLDAIVGRRV